MFVDILIPKSRKLWAVLRGVHKGIFIFVRPIAKGIARLVDAVYLIAPRAVFMDVAEDYAATTSSYGGDPLTLHTYNIKVFLVAKNRVEE